MGEIHFFKSNFLLLKQLNKSLELAVTPMIPTAKMRLYFNKSNSSQCKLKFYINNRTDGMCFWRNVAWWSPNGTAFPKQELMM